MTAPFDCTTDCFISVVDFKLERDWSQHPATQTEVEALTRFIATLRKIAFQSDVLHANDFQDELDRDWDQQPATRSETEALMRVVAAVRDSDHKRARLSRDSAGKAEKCQGEASIVRLRAWASRAAAAAIVPPRQ